MPFTPSHAVAILPFLKTPLPAAALVIGSMAPDLQYFVPLGLSRSLSHSWPGIVTIDLPIGIAALLLWVAFRRPVLDYAPRWLRERMPAPVRRASWVIHVALVLVALELGVLTHLALDLPTHEGWLSELWPWMQGDLGPFTIIRVLHFAFSVVGAVGIAIWARRWVQRTPQVSRATLVSPRERALLWLVLATTLTAVFLGRIAVAVLAGSNPFNGSLWFVAFCLGAAVAGVILLTVCVIWRFRARRATRHTYGVRTPLIVAIALALALAGCANVSDRNADPEDALTPAPTPTATQARETGLEAPTRPFGADCTALMSDSEASAILGGSMELSTTAPDFGYGPRVTVELHGGARCRWLSTGDTELSMSVVLLPAEAAEYNPPRGCTDLEGEFRPRCAVEDVVNGTRVSGWMLADSVGTAEVATAAFLSLFAERAAAITPAPVPIPAVGAWALPVDCVTVVAAGDFSAVPGLGATAVGDDVLGSDFERVTAEGEIALEGPHGLPICEIRGEEATVDFVASGGGRWFETTVSAAATPFAIEGYESAYTSPHQQNPAITNVDVFDGPNWLHFEIRNTSNAKPLADALFAALSTTAAS